MTKKNRKKQEAAKAAGKRHGKLRADAAINRIVEILSEAPSHLGHPLTEPYTYTPLVLEADDDMLVRKLIIRLEKSGAIQKGEFSLSTEQREARPFGLRRLATSTKLD